jgi:hypothetical protein
MAGAFPQLMTLSVAGWRLRLTRPTTALESNLGRSFSSFPVTEMHDAWCEQKVWNYSKVMVVGEGLLGAMRLALRVVACGNAFSLRSNRTLVEASHPSPLRRCMMHGANRRFGVVRK